MGAILDFLSTLLVDPPEMFPHQETRSPIPRKGNSSYESSMNANYIRSIAEKVYTQLPDETRNRIESSRI